MNKLFLLLVLFISTSFSQLETKYRAIYDKTTGELISEIDYDYTEGVPEGKKSVTYTGNPDIILKGSDTLEVLIAGGLKEIAVNNSFPQLPEMGDSVKQGKFYSYEGSVVLCRQTHLRTEHDPITIPNLFSFYQVGENLQWIINENVNVGDRRIYQGVTYICLQPHQTLSNWTPPQTINVLWKAEEQQGEDCPDWVQPSGAHDAYNIGDCVKFNNKCYESTINANVWSPAVLPSGWNEVSCD